MSELEYTSWKYILEQPLTAWRHQEIAKQLDMRLGALFAMHGIRIESLSDWDSCVVRLALAMAKAYEPWLVSAVCEEEPRSAWLLTCAVALKSVSGFKSEAQTIPTQSKWKQHELKIASAVAILKERTEMSQEEIVNALLIWDSGYQSKFPADVLPICNAFRNEFQTALESSAKRDNIVNAKFVERANIRCEKDIEEVTRIFGQSDGYFAERVSRSLSDAFKLDERRKSIVAYAGCYHANNDQLKPQLTVTTERATAGTTSLSGALSLYQLTHRQSSTEES